MTFFSLVLKVPNIQLTTLVTCYSLSEFALKVLRFCLEVGTPRTLIYK